MQMLAVQSTLPLQEMYFGVTNVNWLERRTCVLTVTSHTAPYASSWYVNPPTDGSAASLRCRTEQPLGMQMYECLLLAILNKHDALKASVGAWRCISTVS